MGARKTYLPGQLVMVKFDWGYLSSCDFEGFPIVLASGVKDFHRLTKKNIGLVVKSLFSGDDKLTYLVLIGAHYFEFQPNEIVLLPLTKKKKKKKTTKKKRVA